MIFLIVSPLLLGGAMFFVGQKRLDVVLMNTADYPQPGEIASLLSRGANVRMRNRNGDTPLHAAATSGSADNSATIKLLVAHGGDVNAFNRDGTTPLHYAIMMQNPLSVRALLQCGAKTDVQSKRFGTPLRQATIALKQEIHSRRGWESHLIKIVHLLRAAGAKK